LAKAVAQSSGEAEFEQMNTEVSIERKLVSLNPREARMLGIIFERMFPADENGPGATEIGVVNYVDKALAGPYAEKLEWYRLGLAALERVVYQRYGIDFADCAAFDQDELLSELEKGQVPEFITPPPGAFFDLLRTHLQEGLFSDPIYGGNRNKLGWKILNHPGVWLENSSEENLTSEPVTKGGKIQSLADLDFSTGRSNRDHACKGYDPQRSVLPPSEIADIVLVGLGAMGGMVAPVFAKAGLKVVAFESGPWRTSSDYLPDELGTTYYCRANMGSKFTCEIPRWRRNAGEPTQEATFSLGRMMNSVGGSVIHYGAWLRRFHPHHFKSRTQIRERWGTEVLPADCQVADWPMTYEDLEPYYTLLEHSVGVAGDESNPFVRRSVPLPMPPTRPFRLGEFFKDATARLGLHPHPVPVGMNTTPYQGRPATTYTAWSNGFGSYTGDKWDPSLSSVPEALATGNLDLRTHCRVVRILTDGDGRVGGVEYVDPNGTSRVQRGRIVILSAYTFESLRLMFLSGDARHQAGLGNNSGQLGKNFMTKMFAHVNGYFPDVVFNRHTGPAAQGVVIDDFLSAEFDSMQHGFTGGATLGAEQQFLPIQISREALPPDVRRWGKSYKDHVRNWQHYGVVRIQPDTFSYTSNFLDLDPVYRDKSGLGMPVVRITYDMRENEHKLANWMEAKAEEILRVMGAAKTWRGQRFTGVGSSHDLGGARMGRDPMCSVVSPELEVHDTPGLYVYGGATFPTCPGINPTLTLWAVCYRAADLLVKRLQRGEGA
jgi:gluconate 2-dehydrogenase alpha chain